MKIVFVYPNLTRLERVTLGLAYVASHAQKKGHECHLVDYTWGGGYQKTIDKVRRTGAKLVGLSVKSGEVDFCIGFVGDFCSCSGSIFCTSRKISRDEDLSHDSYSFS